MTYERWALLEQCRQWRAQYGAADPEFRAFVRACVADHSMNPESAGRLLETA